MLLLDLFFIYFIPFFLFFIIGWVWWGFGYPLPGPVEDNARGRKFSIASTEDSESAQWRCGYAICSNLAHFSGLGSIFYLETDSSTGSTYCYCPIGLIGHTSLIPDATQGFRMWDYRCTIPQDNFIISTSRVGDNNIGDITVTTDNDISTTNNSNDIIITHVSNVITKTDTDSDFTGSPTIDGNVPTTIDDKVPIAMDTTHIHTHISTNTNNNTHTFDGNDTKKIPGLHDFSWEGITELLIPSGVEGKTVGTQGTGILQKNICLFLSQI